MISIDTVYQRVLALANKEQRGYITPQDFNLFANQAQMEIFEQYFYDVNMARKGQGNDTVYADIDDMLEEKLQIFERLDSGTIVSSSTYGPVGITPRILPIHYIYRVTRVEYNEVVCEILSTKDFNFSSFLGSFSFSYLLDKLLTYLLSSYIPKKTSALKPSLLRPFVKASVATFLKKSSSTRPLTLYLIAEWIGMYCFDLSLLKYHNVAW